jgi:hypothetical protein
MMTLGAGFKFVVDERTQSFRRYLNPGSAAAKLTRPSNLIQTGILESVSARSEGDASVGEQQLFKFDIIKAAQIFVDQIAVQRRRNKIDLMRFHLFHPLHEQ